MTSTLDKPALQQALPDYLRRQRWFAAKSGTIARAQVAEEALLPDGFPLAVVAVDMADGDSQRYFLPLEPSDDPALDDYAPVPGLVDAANAPRFPHAFLTAIGEGRDLPASGGARLRFSPTQRFADIVPAGAALAALAPKRLSGEQSHTSIAIGTLAILKLYRRLQDGIHPELEIGRFLTEVAGFTGAAPMLGAVELVGADGRTTALAIVQGFLRNRGELWSQTLAQLRADLATTPFAPDLRLVEVLGTRTAEMHLAFATPTDDPAFAPQPFTAADRDAALADAQRLAAKAMDSLARLGGGNAEAAALLARRTELEALLAGFASLQPAGLKTRIHGDYHLGQVLATEDGDVAIVDFEGEPTRSLDDRRGKYCPLRDVAGMLRSYAYAADTVARELPDKAVLAADWMARASAGYLGAYEARLAGAPVAIADPRAREGLLRLFLLSKALYEVLYEAENRPAWIGTPIRGVLTILDQAGTQP